MRPGTALGAVIVAAALFLASCGGSAGSGGGTTTPSPTAATTPPLEPPHGAGAYGYITAGPTCPVERPDHPCPPHPVSAVVEARDSGGLTVASAASDSFGRYALGLSPGAYVLVVVTANGWPRCPDTHVTVQPGSATRADLSCDTGIR